MNIIYLVCHDLGRHLGCYGRNVLSPNLDRFFKERIQFNQAFTTSAVCSPSRGCTMTGQYSHKNGLVGLSHFGWKIDSPTIVDYFNEAGYETIHTGLSHEGHACQNRYQIDFERSWNSRNAENAIDDAIALLHARKDSQLPFYLNIGTQEVHRCVWDSADHDEAPSRLQRVYDGPIDEAEVHLPPHIPDYPPYREFLSRFQASIQYFDRQVGRLLDCIGSLGYLENSMVVITTDHGIAASRGKGTLYDAGLEVALGIHHPQASPSQASCDHLIQNIDMAPTLLEACGITPPESMDGRSFLPLLKGEAYEPHQQLFQQWNFGGGEDDFNPSRAIRTKDFHYIRNLPPQPPYNWLPSEVSADAKASENPYLRPWPDFAESAPEEELFDLRADPHELHNVATSAEYAERMEQFRAQLETWMHDHDDYLLRGEKPRLNGQPGWGIEAS